MTALEIRIVGYGALVLALILGGAYLGARHVQAKWNVDTIARDQALQKQQDLVIDFQKQRDALQVQVDQSHAQIIATGQSLVDGVSNSLRGVEAALRSRSVPAAVANPGAVQNGKPGADGHSDFNSAFESVAAAIKDLAAECVKVDADRTSILSLEPH